MDEITQIRQNIYKFIEESAKAIPDIESKQVLDIGIEGDPPPSGNFKWFKNAHEFKTADVNPLFKPDYVDDITRSNFPDNRWDVVICSQVIEHVWDVDKAIRHLYRILKPGGYLIIDCPWHWPWHATPLTKDYWRLSPDAFDKLLAQFQDRKIRMTEDGTLVCAVCRK